MIDLAASAKGRVGGVVEILRRGGSLLKEACPRCGGLQVRYKDRTLCVNCDDMSDLSAVEAPRPSEVAVDLRDLVSRKIAEVSLQLKGESDIEKQTQLATLLLRYVELLEKAAAALKTGQSA